MRRVAWLSAIACVLLAGCASAPPADTPFTVYLVRHAEKLPGPDRDPPLSATGEQRARWMAKQVSGRDIAAVWSSDYQRTRSTAAPIAGAAEVEVQLYDPRNLAQIADRLRSDAVNAVVVGHSNTTPELAALLCGCTVEVMDESEYDRALVVSYKDGAAKLRTLTMPAHLND